jgi:uncharacterized protein YbjT (DUF2867 family)
MTAIAVTGSTGRIGGRVARRLAEAGVPQRLVVRDATRAPRLHGAEARVAAYADRAAVTAALAGVQTVLMVSGAEDADRLAHHRAFVDAAVAAGVQHLVYLSFYRPRPDATFTLVRDHWATEEHIRDSGLNFTFLRDNLYADLLPLLAADRGVLQGPAGDGRVSLVAIDDISEVAALVLRQPDASRGAAYELTGPEALSLTEAAAVMTAALGRPIRYQPESLAEAYASRASYGAPAWLVEAWVTTYTAIATGELAGVSSDIERLTGHPATPLAEVLRRQAG